METCGCKVVVRYQSESPLLRDAKFSLKEIKYCPLHSAAPETAAERDRLREVNATMLEALEPFATIADECDKAGKLNFLYSEWRIKSRDLRKARAAIAAAKGGSDQ